MFRNAGWVAALGAVSFASIARAEETSPAAQVVRADTAQPTPEVDVESSGIPSDPVERPPAGGASFRLRPTLQGDFGTWAYAPSTPGRSVASVVGGEVALTSRLSLVLEGAQDGFNPGVSGMFAGARLHLMPTDSHFQMSLAAGGLRDMARSPGAWTEVSASENVGRFRFAGSLRVTRLYGDLEAQQLISGSAGASVDLRWARVGVDYAFERGIVSRAAILPWVAVAAGRRSTFRITGAVPLSGDNVFPARFSYIGSF